MKIGLLPLVVVTGGLIAAAVVVALVVGTSGGGDDGSASGPDPSDVDTSTLQGYFQALNIVQTDIRTEYSTVEGQYPEAFVEKQATVDYLNHSADVWATGVTQLEGIEAPDEAAEEHLALVQATDDVSAAFRDLRTTAQDTEEAELATMVENADTTAFGSYTTTCQELQAVADDNAVMDEAGQPVFVVC